MINRALGWVSFSAIVYEYFLTLEDEVKYIWPSRWTSVKIIFLLTRYGNIGLISIGVAEQAHMFAHKSDRFCANFGLVLGILVFISFGLMHVLVVIKAWAVWRRNRGVALALVALLVCYAALITAFLSVRPSIAKGVCASNIYQPMWLIWFGSLLLECIVFALTCWSIRRNLGANAHWCPLVRIIVRDGLLYFVLTASINIINIAMWSTSALTRHSALAIMSSLSVTTIASHRLILNIRAAHARSCLVDYDVSFEIEQQLARASTPAAHEMGLHTGSA
ncbi:hypothetical protein PLICRDRAFT_184677 [Plicaturopsis crispa FD-325 SS-3]|nr:hypothetical protein PLICRDRAFT_184677 [Plicaturopsis crispa FD-325 SS-3]